MKRRKNQKNYLKKKKKVQKHLKKQINFKSKKRNQIWRFF